LKILFTSLNENGLAFWSFLVILEKHFDGEDEGEVRKSERLFVHALTTSFSSSLFLSLSLSLFPLTLSTLCDTRTYTSWFPLFLSLIITTLTLSHTHTHTLLIRAHSLVLTLTHTRTYYISSQRTQALRVFLSYSNTHTTHTRTHTLAFGWFGI